MRTGKQDAMRPQPIPLLIAIGCALGAVVVVFAVGARWWQAIGMIVFTPLLAYYLARRKISEIATGEIEEITGCSVVSHETLPGGADEHSRTGCPLPAQAGRTVFL